MMMTAAKAVTTSDDDKDKGKGKDDKDKGGKGDDDDDDDGGESGEGGEGDDDDDDDKDDDDKDKGKGDKGTGNNESGGDDGIAGVEVGPGGAVSVMNDPIIALPVNDGGTPEPAPPLTIENNGLCVVGNCLSLGVELAPSATDGGGINVGADLGLTGMVGQGSGVAPAMLAGSGSPATTAEPAIPAEPTTPPDSIDLTGDDGGVGAQFTEVEVEVAAGGDVEIDVGGVLGELSGGDDDGNNGPGNDDSGDDETNPMRGNGRGPILLP